MLILWGEKAILSSCGDARHLISININIKNAHSTGTASRWEKARTWTCLHANIHAVKHGVMNVMYLHMLGKTTEKFIFLDSPEGISSIRRTGLKQDVGIEARI